MFVRTNKSRAWAETKHYLVRGQHSPGDLNCETFFCCLGNAHAGWEPTCMGSDGSIAMKILLYLLMVVMFAPCETGPHARVC